MLKVVFYFSLLTCAVLSNHKKCWIKHRSETASVGGFFAHLKICPEWDTCCEEGCCSVQNRHELYPYPYTWEIVLTALLIFITVLTCVCACYYCKNSWENREVLAVRGNGTNWTSRQTCVSTVGNQANIAATPPPPPPYDVAIILPPIRQNDNLPSYDEVMSTKRF